MSRSGGRQRRHALAAAAMALASVLAAGAADLDSCRSIDDDRARLACFDALAAAAPAAGTGTAPTATTATTPAAGAGQLAPATPTAADLFGRDSSTAAAELGAAAGVAPLRELRATLATVDRAPDGRLRLTLDNDQAWAQVDTRYSDLKPGDAVVIRRGAFGSFLLSADRGRAAVRVRRDR
ncbi:MAG: hypothetical protein JNM50_08975 [Chromatiales bacterium]|nr:hypothetical protein [Chromatiales bacterium]